MATTVTNLIHQHDSATTTEPTTLPATERQPTPAPMAQDADAWILERCEHWLVERGWFIKSITRLPREVLAICEHEDTGQTISATAETLVRVLSLIVYILELTDKRAGASPAAPQPPTT